MSEALAIEDEGDGGRVTIRWRRMGERSSEPGRRAWRVILVTDGTTVVPVEDYGEGYWDLTRWNYDGNDELDFTPTHWAPLPSPPTTTS